MKKRFYFPVLGLLALLSVVFVACEKQAVEPETSSKKSKEVNENLARNPQQVECNYDASQFISVIVPNETVGDPDTNYTGELICTSDYIYFEEVGNSYEVILITDTLANVHDFLVSTHLVEAYNSISIPEKQITNEEFASLYGSYDYVTEAEGYGDCIKACQGYDMSTKEGVEAQRVCERGCRMQMYGKIALGALALLILL